MRQTAILLIWFILVGISAARSSPDSCETARKEQDECRKTLQDWPDLARYRDADDELPRPTRDEPRIVFMGDSITQMWDLAASFPGKPYLNRGISGQTTPQMLIRFRQDVVDLNPKVVVILAGTNDVAENTGPTTLPAIEDNFMSMVEIAKRNGIRVVLATVLPVARYPWRPDVDALAKIPPLNKWIKEYAQKEDVVLLDYYAATVDQRGGMKSELSEDGVHPNKAGYGVMVPLAEKAIAGALGKK